MSISNSIKAFLLKRITSKKQLDCPALIENIIFLRYDRIGDMIISTPVFREFKKKFPNANLIVLASSTNKDVIKYNPYVDEIYLNNKYNFLSDFPALLSLRRKKIDVAIEFDHSVVPHAILRLKIIKPKFIVSVQKDGRYGVKGEKLKLYDHYSNKNDTEHAANRWMKTLEIFDIYHSFQKYDIHIDHLRKKRAKDFCDNLQSDYLVGFNFEGAVKGKKIDFLDFKIISNELFRTNKKIKFLIFCHPIKYSFYENKLKNSGIENAHLTYKTESILDLAAIVRRLSLVISPDTSIVHVASTFNIPIISVHERNPNSFNLFKPTSKISHTVFSNDTKSLKGYDIDKLIETAKKILR